MHLVMLWAGGDLLFLVLFYPVSFSVSVLVAEISVVSCCSFAITGGAITGGETRASAVENARLHFEMASPMQIKVLHSPSQAEPTMGSRFKRICGH